MDMGKSNASHAVLPVRWQIGARRGRGSVDESDGSARRGCGGGGRRFRVTATEGGKTSGDNDHERGATAHMPIMRGRPTGVTGSPLLIHRCVSAITPRRTSDLNCSPVEPHPHLFRNRLPLRDVRPVQLASAPPIRCGSGLAVIDATLVTVRVGDNDPLMSTTAWIAAGASLLALAAFVAMVRMKRGNKDLGSVSDRWIAQHRADKTFDLR